MAKTYNWGIIGLGSIAHKFADALTVVPNARLHAVASRSAEKASKFAQQYNASHYYGNYEAIVHDREIDAIYIATPHNLHYQNTMMCLKQGIPVLCEKPFAINAKEAAGMIELARSNNIFLMEAFWTRFLPGIKKVLELIQSGAIGQIKMVKADFGFKAEFNPSSRLFDLDLGGGSLLDVGVYPLFLSLLLLGKPSSIKAISHIGRTGVDENCGIIFDYSNGEMANLFSSIVTDTITQAEIFGETGSIRIHKKWFMPSPVSLIKGDKEEKFEFDFTGNGYNYEIEEVVKCLEEGKTESELLPLDFSLDLMELLDHVKKECGIHYPSHDD